MECITPPTLDERQFLELLDGTASEQITTHLKKCPYCQTQAHAYRRMNKRLKSRLFRVECPPALELGEFYLRMLPAARKLVVSQHVRSCPHCTRELAELTEALGAEVIQVDDSSAGKVQVLMATLLSGTADALRGENKIITLQVDETVLSFDVQSAPHGMISLLGQIAAEKQDLWTGAVVTILQEGAPRQTASVSDLGAFHFSAIQPGESEITISSLYDVIIQVKSLTLKT